MPVEGFYPILLEILRRLDLSGSQTQTEAVTLFGNKIQVSLGKSRKEAGAVIPHLVIVDGDEEPAPPSSTYATAIGTFPCMRELAVWVLVSRGDHTSKLNRLMDAIIGDFEMFRPIDRILAVEYKLGDSDYDATDAVALRAVLFQITYLRR